MEKIRLLTFLLQVLYTCSDNPKPKYLVEYIFVENNMSWSDARQYCQRNYKELFRISDGNNLTGLSGSANQLSWIGLQRKAVLWNWVDGSKALYVNWFRLENCAAVSREGLWLDMPCDTVQPYACQRAPGIWAFGTSDLSWRDAKEKCVSQSNTFAIIRDETDNGNISAMAPSPVTWIGLTKVVDETPSKDTWTWGNNQPFTYGNWFTPHFCAVMNQRGFWFDRLCFEEHPFVCFKETNSIPEFSLVKETKTWHDAQSHCKTLEMNLVMAKTQEENTALLGNISSFFDGDSYLWIGLQNDPWYWSDYGSSDVRNWNSKQPDGNDFWNNPFSGHLETCVASMNGEWYDENCSMPLPFFCSATVRSVILVSEPKSWEEALEHCRGAYVDLASLASDAEQVVAVRKIQDAQNGYVWTGLRFLAGSWFWVYGDSLQYENWMDDGDQQCPVTHRCGALTVPDGKWEARPCDEELNFLCFQNV